MSDASPLSGISGLLFDFTLLSALFFCLLPLLFLPSFRLFFCLRTHFPDFLFQKILPYFSVRGRLFGMAFVQQLVSVFAAFCHMAMVFATMHL